MRAFSLFITLIHILSANSVSVGLEEFFAQHIHKQYAGKKAGLVTNHTGIDADLNTSVSKFDAHPDGPQIKVLFFPEHGLNGSHWAEEQLQHGTTSKRKVYSLHGQTRRPDVSMLKGLDLIIFDIQDIGARSYTYISTLLYVMEEAKKGNLEVIVLDRPNPMGGLLVDGPMLETRYKSFIGYINVPYCHGMTVGEIAKYFNEETGLHCKLKVVKMKGWKRSMNFNATGLPWVPTSPYIPEADTPFFYSTTGLLGSLHLVNIGIGYTLPFKILGAPYIEGEKFAAALNELNLPGVKFLAFSFKPFYGNFKGEVCHGVKIMIHNTQAYLPVKTAFGLMGMLKSLYPHEFDKAVNFLTLQEIETFSKVCGTQDILTILKTEKFPTWKLLTKYDADKKAFMEKRTPYLLY